MKKYFLWTFWCVMNNADSEKIKLIMLEANFKAVTNFLEADLVLLNTCSVRKKWEDKVFWLVEEIIKENIKRQKENQNSKEIKIWITGCMVRKTWLNSKYHQNKNRDRNKSKKISLTKFQDDIFNHDDKLFPRSKWKIDFVFRIEDIKYLTFILSTIYQERIWNEYKYDNYLKAKALRDKQFSVPIVIQTWCDNFCSYCIVPYSRWLESSRKQEDIVEEAKEAVKSGAREITLVGQNVNSYWKQFLDKKYWNEEKGKWNDWIWKSPFRKLLEELDEIEWLDRIRFTSSNPHDMTQDILDAHFELKKTCNYLHFALQSWNNEILKKMNRKHSYEDFKEMTLYLREKDPYFSISTDIICGFSWETDEMFKDTLKAFEELNFDFSYNARYSIRKWTLAEKLYPDDISDQTKADRWHKLNNKLLETLSKRNKMMIWKTEEILVSWQKDDYYYGRTRNYKEVFFKWENIKIGDIVKVKIEKLNKYVLNWTQI